jgi:argininosuccinate synthase
VKSPVILAFSGGLDTSFCIPYLREQGREVISLFVDTGGVDDAGRAAIEKRALELGAIEHVTADGSNEVFQDVVVPLVMGGQLYQNQYPLLVSDRYVIVKKSLELANARGSRTFAHGCTGMGNDQVRFDLTVRGLGDYEILAPIREIQQKYAEVRKYEREYLEARGFRVDAKQTTYTINENVLGVTLSGSEIDAFGAPGPGTYAITKPPSDWPREALSLRIGFEHGVPVRLDGEKITGPALLKRLNASLGAYGVGRGIYTGDTTIGLKGRIVFEAPALTGLIIAHRALEEAVLSREQNGFKPLVAQKWVDLVYRGFFYDPLKRDLERYLKSSQEFVNGEVTLRTEGGLVHAVAIDSPHLLQAKNAVYAQSADWGAVEAEGFIRLYGQSTTLSAKINPIDWG